MILSAPKEADRDLLRPAQPGTPAWASLLLQPFRPPLETVRHYNARKFRKDIIAGLTVSVVEVPQAMAYALIAGVPAQYGLYTSVIQGIVGALLSSSEHVTTGPTNTQSLLIASAVHRLVDPTADPAQYLQLVFALTLMKGLLQLAFAAASMGNMVRYVSRSVITGLVSGAGILILFGQLPAFLGITSPENSHLPGILAAIMRLAQHTGELNGRSIALGLLVILLTLGAKRISRFAPGPLVGVVLSGVVVWSLHWTGGQVPLIQPLPRGVPHFHVPWPGWANAEALFGGALALAIIGMLESVAIAKSIASHTGESISANQEFFAQGLKNSLTSFLQCIPGSASFSRSALDYQAGAETRFAAVYNACFVGCIFWLFADEARFIPRAALAGVLFVIGAGLVDWQYLRRMIRTSRADAVVCLITFLATLFAPLEYAVFIGVFLNIGLYLRIASRLHLNEMILNKNGGPFVERELTDRAGENPVRLLQLEGDLFFGIADELGERLGQFTRQSTRVVVFRLRRTHSIDATVLYVMERFVRDMHARSGHVLLCGVRPELATTLKNFGLTDVIGGDNIFETGHGIFGSAKRALDRAAVLVGRSIDTQGLDVNDEETSWTYEI